MEGDMTILTRAKNALRRLLPGRRPKKNLYLHVGTHKTGTTSFQKSLRANRAGLIRQGFFPFGVRFKTGGKPRKRLSYHAFSLTHIILRPELAGNRRASLGLDTAPEAVAELRARLLRRLRAREEESIIVSAESLCFLRTPEEKGELQRFLADVGRAVKVVLVFRNEADWRASWTNQLTKNRPEGSRGRRGDRPDAQRLNGEWYYDKPAIIAFWKDIGELTIL
ncbi:MAG: hypothetical protein D6801_02920, partial [Alphaproteobacteria bacterium]